MINDDKLTRLTPKNQPVSLASCSKIISQQNQMASILTDKLVKQLGLSSKNSLDDFVKNLKKLAESKNFGKNKLKNLIPKRQVKEVFDRILTLRKQDGTTKELFITFLLIILGDIEKKTKNITIKYLADYVDKSNIVAGFGKTHGRRQGFDVLTIKMNKEKDMVSSISFGELKYRYNLETILSRNQLPFSKSRKKKIKELKGKNKLGQYLIFNSSLECLPDTGFSFNSTYNRGNDLIIKMKSWDKHIHEIITSDNTFTLNSKILTRKLPNGKPFYQALKEAILEQAYLEALCENGLIFDEEGKIKTEHIFSIAKKGFKIRITTEDFEICKSYQKDETGRYITFNLVSRINDNFPDILKENKDRYKVYITEGAVHTFSICKESYIIVTSENYYKQNKQKLIAEIKTRFINDFRDFKLLSHWENVIEDEAKIRSDLLFVTSSPNETLNKNGWSIWENLKRGKEENLLFGSDRVYQYALKPPIGNRLALKSKWFLELNEALEGKKTYSRKQVKKHKLIKLKKKKEEDVCKSYRELRKRWHKSGYPNISKYGKINPENLFGLGISNKASIATEWSKLKIGEEYIAENRVVNIKSIFVEPDSFYNSYLDFQVVLIQKDGSNQKIILEKQGLKPLIINNVTIPKQHTSLFPYPTEKVRNGKPNTYFRRGFMDKNVLGKTYQVLKRSEFLYDSDRQILEVLYEIWDSNLSEKGKVEVLFNSIEATILLIETLKIMENLTKQLFKRLKSNKRLLRHLQIPSKFPFQIASKRSFKRHYAFGLIAESTSNHKKYVVYELLGDDLLNFLILIRTRLDMMVKYYKEYRWTKSVKKITREIKQLLRKYDL